MKVSPEMEHACLPETAPTLFSLYQNMVTEVSWHWQSTSKQPDGVKQTEEQTREELTAVGEGRQGCV